MAKVIGFDPKLNKKFTCYDCTAIVEYPPNEETQLIWDDGRPATDEGCKIYGLKCPNCGSFHRTNQ